MAEGFVRYGSLVNPRRGPGCHVAQGRLNLSRVVERRACSSPSVRQGHARLWEHVVALVVEVTACLAAEPGRTSPPAGGVTRPATAAARAGPGSPRGTRTRPPPAPP